MNRALQRKIAIIVSMDSKAVGKHTALIRQKLDRLKNFSRRVFRTAAIGTAAMTAAMGFLGKSVLDTGIAFEKFQIQLQVLFGSVEKGKKKFEWIKTFAKSTPYELDQVVDSFVKLKATGLAADKDNLLRDLGDLASAAQKPLQQVVMAISNIASGMTGIGVRQLMLLNINRDMLSAQGAVFSKQGALISDNFQLIKAVQGVIKANKFSGMMKEQARTLGGVLTNVKDAWTQMKAEVAEKIFPIIKPDLEKLRDAMFGALDTGRMTTWAESIAEMFTKGYRSAKEWVPKVGRLFANVVSSMVDVFKPIGKFFIENPGMVKTALILVVLSKAIMMAKELAMVMKSIGVLALTSKLGKFLAAASVATSAVPAAAAVSTAGATGVAGAASAVLPTVGSVIPIVAGVLAAGAIGFGAYKLWQKYGKSAVDKSVGATAKLTEARRQSGGASAFSKNMPIPFVQYDVKGIRGLVEEYKDLTMKTTLSADEQERYNAVVENLIRILPSATIETGKYGKVLGINITQAEKALKVEEQRLKLMQKQLEYYQRDAVKAVKEAAESVNLEDYDKLNQVLMDSEKQMLINQPLIEGTKLAWESVTSEIQRLEKTGIAPGSPMMGQLTDSADRLQRQLKELSEPGNLYVNTMKQLEQLRERAKGVAEQLIEIYQIDSLESLDTNLPARWGGEWKKWITLVLEDMGRLAKADTTPPKPDDGKGDSQFDAVKETKAGSAIIKRLMDEQRKTLQQRAILSQTDQEKEKTKIAQKYSTIRRDIFEKIELGVLASPAEIEKMLGIDVANKILKEGLDFEGLEKEIESGKIDPKKMGLIGLSIQMEQENVRLAELADVRNKVLATKQETELITRSAYLNSVQKLELEHSMEMERIQSRADLQPEQKQELLAEQDRLKEADIQRARAEQWQSYHDEIRTLEENTSSLSMENLEEYYNQRILLEDNWKELKIAIDNDEVITAEQKMALLAAIDEKSKKEEIKRLLKQTKVREKITGAGINVLTKMSKAWAATEFKNAKDVKNAGIQAVGEEVAAILQSKATEWRIKAIAAAAEMNYAKAAGLALAAAAAGAGVAYVHSITTPKQEEDNRDFGASVDTNDFSSDSDSSRTHSNFSTRGVQNMYVQPSIAFSAETMIIGSTGIEDVAETIKDIAVQGLKEAMETGEINLGVV